MPLEDQNTLIQRWDTAHPRWDELMALTGVEDLHLEAKTQSWHGGPYTLVALEADAIAGVLRFWTQEIGIDEDRPPLIVPGGPATEAKVVTFWVAPEQRRRGIGRQLQTRCVEWTLELGCYQVRSRSPYAASANHMMKASLGFGISPGRNRPDGNEATAFFVLPLALAPDIRSLLAQRAE